MPESLDIQMTFRHTVEVTLRDIHAYFIDRKLKKKDGLKISTVPTVLSMITGEGKGQQISQGWIKVVGKGDRSKG